MSMLAHLQPFFYQALLFEEKSGQICQNSTKSAEYGQNMRDYLTIILIILDIEL